MVVDREYELRRLKRHLHVQENRVRAAGNKLNKLDGRVVSAAWRAHAESAYEEAVAGRDGLKRMIEELEANVNGEAENERPENGGESKEKTSE